MVIRGVGCQAFHAGSARFEAGTPGGWSNALAARAVFMLLTDGLYVLIRIWRRSIAREVHLRVKHASQSHACRLMLSMGGLCFPAKEHRKPRDACTTFDT